ncbi:MAG: hypothetical protein MJZ99_03285 [Bacteroidales bacterium]|nr:hypothetical protein [Bacteroidales bacterium]
MSHKSLTILSGMIVLSMCFSSCLKKGDDTLVLPVPDGKIPYYVIPARLQDSLRTHGFEIYEGIEPPFIEGTYLASPMELQYASDDYSNHFYDLTLHFASQFRRGMLRYCESQTDTVMGQSTVASVIGKGNNFTMYCLQNISNLDNQGDTLFRCRTATVVSGTIEAGGIRNCQYTNIVLDKWAVNDYYEMQLADINSYRIWKDGDSLSVKLAK